MKKTSRMKNIKGTVAAGLAAAGMFLLPLAARAQEYTNAVVNNITNNMKLTWNWKDVYEVKASPSNASRGTVNGNTNNWIDSGSNVNLEAIASQYYDFSGWSGDVPAGKENENPLSYASDAPRTITANFAPQLAPEHGTPLYWLTGQYGETDENADPDSDGMPNWKEYVAGTDPTNRLDYLCIKSMQNLGSSTRTLSWNGKLGKYYTVQKKQSILEGSGSWTNLEDYLNVPGTGSTMSCTNNSPSNAEFYRLKVE